MFLGVKLRDKRQQQRLNQLQLASGICTQATVSRMERQNIPPSIDVLIKLCQRLELTLDQVFSEFSTSGAPTSNLFLELDSCFIDNDFKGLNNLIEEFEIEHLTSQYERAHFYYLSGYISLLMHKNSEDALFKFNFVLEILNNDKKSIFGLLSYIGIGQIYYQKQQIDKSKHYFELVLGAIKKVYIQNDTQYFWFAKAISDMSVFYSNIGEYKISNELIALGVSPSKGYYSTIFADKLYFVLSVNHSKDSSIDYKEISHTLTTARAFAEYNRNEKLLVQIDNFIHEKNFKLIEILPQKASNNDY
ncbi:helix-turn-helix domain-containing protein [Paucilactobacillus oligofermentans DSM 15707 = LMG 22743]|uniref:Helix-turn-helix domain-containing protein n=1 Tax=Paucilactobacillus oligofermentans DSM 15707 = LMG 22743 TaxID=1423778 RepID=A0A0R1RRE0_9LACO|nr:helix-turn-helix transcriptional regulator [Paucilactobacillus oligofermentans]KRL57732.1 helix-turn-helix domain-containing protein [Paucilactobacillus oligofermentans DSM 15707 = LMG 22743]CUS26821.1 Helix-turn-helix XRE-family transcriptional regulator [Paucilactobacillus oligofermentans DSM 15707 = LMG 22743]